METGLSSERVAMYMWLVCDFTFVPYHAHTKTRINQEKHNTWLTNQKPNNRSKESKQPEDGRKGWNEMKKAAKEAAYEERKLPAKLVRDGTHANATDKKSGKNDRCWDKTQWSTVTHKIKLWNNDKNV